ncbi:MAG: glycosyltransferase family 2 protein [bacterium]
MTVIGIADLPTPEQTLSGWPWTEEGIALPATLPDNQIWPRISIITPSLNQGEFLERTIRSVLLQGYPTLEYIIVDGGSTDGSVAIIKKYAAHLAYHVSEPDGGYVQAINKGLRLTTGEIICWLNSDDFYLKDTLRSVAERLATGTGRAAIVGHVLKVYEDGRASQKIIGKYESLSRLLKFWRGYQMHQPSIFWRREVFETIGYLDEERDLIADFDYWVRVGRRFQFSNVDQILSCATHHARAKTADGCRGYHKELKMHARSYWGSPFSLGYWLLTGSMIGFLHLRPRLDPAINLARYFYRAIEHQLETWTIRKRKSA